MTWVCKEYFVGIMGGMELRFVPGDTVSDAAAEEMGLANKPELATNEVQIDDQTANP